MERLSKSAFKLRSGNKPSASKLMGVSPAKHTEIIRSEGDDVGNIATGIATTNTEPIGKNLIGPSAIADSGITDIGLRSARSSDQLRKMAAGDFGGIQRLGITSRFRKA